MSERFKHPLKEYEIETEDGRIKVTLVARWHSETNNEAVFEFTMSHKEAQNLAEAILRARDDIIAELLS